MQIYIGRSLVPQFLTDSFDLVSPARANLALAEEAGAGQSVRKPREEAAAQPVRRCRWYYHMGWHAQRRTHSGRM
jgi:hypothetical protein